jgi:hypothetical protein
MGSKTPLVLTVLIAVAGCETSQPASPPLPTEAELNCPAVDGYSRERLEASSTYIDRPVESFVPEALSEAPLPDEAVAAQNRLRVRMFGRPDKSITYWRDENTGLWNLQGVRTYQRYSWNPSPPPPPPPPPPEPEDEEAYERYIQRQAEEAARRAEAVERARNRPPLPSYRTLNAESSERLDQLFFDQCVAAGPEHIPGWFDPYVCPSDGNSWAGEIVLNGGEPRLVAVGCRNAFALSQLLANASWPNAEDLMPLGPEYD